MTFLEPTKTVVSALNSTTATLGISGVFTGVFESCKEFAEIKISFDADVAGVDCIVQFSHDGVKIERTISIPPLETTLNTNFGGTHTLNPSLPFFRIIYTNDVDAQADFSLTATLAVRSGGGLTSRSLQVLNKFNDVSLSRLVNDPQFDRNEGLIAYLQSMRAFGFNNTVGTGSFVTIWPPDTVYTFPQVAETLQVATGGNPADTSAGAGARQIEVDFLDSNWVEQTEVLTLAGATASAATSSTAYRFLRAKVINSGTYGASNTGAINIENSSTNTLLGHIPATLGRSQGAFYTVPANKTIYVTRIFVSVGQADSADVRLFMIPNADDFAAPFTSVRGMEWDITDFTGAEKFPQDTYLKFDEKTDLIFEAERNTGSGDASITVDFEFLLFDN